MDTEAKAPVAAPPTTADQASEADVAKDPGRLGPDPIAQLIDREFKGHEMTRLVEAILISQGYVTHLSPPGPDRGVDILAAPAPLGFGRPPHLRAGEVAGFAGRFADAPSVPSGSMQNGSGRLL